MKTRVLISFMVVALWLWAAPAVDAEQHATGAPDSSGRVVAKPDANPLDQGTRSTTQEDIALTQDIRREVTKDASLSTMAQNIGIISVDGVVTLRGPVESAVERIQVAALTERIAGNGKVHNQLEIALATREHFQPSTRAQRGTRITNHRRR